MYIYKASLAFTSMFGPTSFFRINYKTQKFLLINNSSFEINCKRISKHALHTYNGSRPNYAPSDLRYKESRIKKSKKEYKTEQLSFKERIKKNINFQIATSIVEACQHTSAVNSPQPFPLWKKHK